MADTTTTTTRQLDTALATATASLPEVKDALVPYHEATGEELARTGARPA